MLRDCSLKIGGEIFKQHAEQSEMMGKLEDAQKNYTEALQFTNDPKVYEAYIKILEKREKYMSSGLAYKELGDVYKEQGKFNEAAKAYTRAIKYLCENEEVLLTIIETYRSLHDPLKEAHWTKELARLHKKNRRLSEASNIYQKAFELSQETDILLKLSKIYAKRSKIAETDHSKKEYFEENLRLKEKFFQKKLEENPKDLKIHLKFKKFLKSLGRIEESGREKIEMSKLIKELTHQAQLYHLLQPHIEALDFSNPIDEDKPKMEIKLKHFREIIDQAPKLTSLNLRHCYQLNHPDIYRMLENKKFKVLLLPTVKPAYGLKYLLSKAAFSINSPYFIPKSIMDDNNWQSVVNIGQYQFIDLNGGEFSRDLSGKKPKQKMILEKYSMQIINTLHGPVSILKIVSTINKIIK